MAKKKRRATIKTDEQASTPKPPEEKYASWWQNNLSRREMNKKILIGSAIGATALLVVLNQGNDEDEYEETYTAVAEHDALQLQRSSGWNVGGTSDLRLAHTSLSDSKGGQTWKELLQPAALLAAYKPANETLQPFVVPTLVQSLGESSLRSAMQPVFNPAMQRAYGCGLGMRDILKKSDNPGSTMIVVDMAGPESVAFAAALSDIAEPLINFDNWPHSSGRVKSHETLAAMLYYGAEVQENRSKRPATKAPVVIVLDNERITPLAAGDVTTFDNRYIAKMPTAKNLKDMGISHVLYVKPSGSNTQETDDLNEDFASYGDEHIDIALLPLSDFSPDTAAADTAMPDTAAPTGSSTASMQARTATTPYYYGGHAHGNAFFFFYGGMYRSARSIPSSYTPPSSVRRPSYTAARRATIFSSRSVGATAKGVGKQRPTGFGRVSTAVNSRSGKMMVGRTGTLHNGPSGRSPGRSGGGFFGRSRGSGSFGRSGGRGFSS